MPWRSLGEFKLVKTWLFSESVEGEIFRVRHKIINDLPQESLRAVIAQGFIDEDRKPNKFGSKIFTYGEELQVFTFYFPEGLSKHSIILKRLDQSPIDWIVEVEVFYSDNPEQDYQNYITNRFGKAAINYFSQNFITNNMALYPLLYSGSTTPNSHSHKLLKDKGVKIASENQSRTELRIQSSGHSVMLCTGFAEDGKPLEILLRVPPNYYYQDVITSAGIYKGEVWAICDKETLIHVTEFSAK